MATDKTVTIYSTPSCHFCHMAKEFFTENDVKFTDHNVVEDMDARQEMLEKSGQMGVPVIFIGDDMIVGFDEPKIRGLLGL
jgi:glutaredoxin-like YruB-family protein